MAQSKKTDNLFRDKLNYLEVVPKDDSWAQVQQGLQTKATPWGWYGAGMVAAVMLIILSFIKWPSTTYLEKNQITGSIDHPKIQIPAWLDSPLIKVDKKVELQPNQTLAKAPTKRMIETAEMDNTTTEGKLAMEQLTPIRNITTIEKVNTHELVKIEDHENITIKITYIAAESYENEDRNKLSKVISVAQKLTPADMLADIRDAKNNLLNRN